MDVGNNFEVIHPNAFQFWVSIRNFQSGTFNPKFLNQTLRIWVSLSCPRIGKLLWRSSSDRLEDFQFRVTLCLIKLVEQVGRQETKFAERSFLGTNSNSFYLFGSIVFPTEVREPVETSNFLLFYLLHSVCWESTCLMKQKSELDWTKRTLEFRWAPPWNSVESTLWTAPFGLHSLEWLTGGGASKFRRWTVWFTQCEFREFTALSPRTPIVATNLIAWAIWWTASRRTMDHPPAGYFRNYYWSMVTTEWWNSPGNCFFLFRILTHRL